MHSQWLLLQHICEQPENKNVFVLERFQDSISPTTGNGHVSLSFKVLSWDFLCTEKPAKERG